MSSHHNFSFPAARFIPSVVCMTCGNNAHIVRREPRGETELQTFKCAECGAERQRTEMPDLRDEGLQAEAEKRSGVGSRVR